MATTRNSRTRLLTNWLPAPEGSFNVMLRRFWPGPGPKPRSAPGTRRPSAASA